MYNSRAHTNSCGLFSSPSTEHPQCQEEEEVLKTPGCTKTNDWVNWNSMRDFYEAAKLRARLLFILGLPLVEPCMKEVAKSVDHVGEAVA